MQGELVSGVDTTSQKGEVVAIASSEIRACAWSEVSQLAPPKS